MLQAVADTPVVDLHNPVAVDILVVDTPAVADTPDMTCFLIWES
jgi:hypothetical protein